MITSIHEQTGHSLRLIHQILGLPRSSFYLGAKLSQRQVTDLELTQAITLIFRQHLSRYGVRRIRATLQAQGLCVSEARVRRLMAAAALRAHQPRTFVPRTSDGRADAPSPNLLLDRAPPSRPNQVWVSDFTYIPCGSSFVYLCIVMDLYSRRVVGWSLADHMRSELVTDALRSAIDSRCNLDGLILHSDRGSQYASKAFRKLLSTAHMQQSMSARANPYHNAWAESVIGTLKGEMLRDGRFLSLEDAHIEITAYIDCYYNTQRIHSSLSYTTPVAFEAKILNAA
jgi:putative transposase